MIDLTPIDIRKKKGDFPRSLRGYEAAEVDLFLDLAADRLEEVVTHAREVEARLQEVESELAEYRQRERALTEALVSAENLRAEYRRRAEEEAALIRKAAELAAEELRKEAHEAVAREEERVRRIRAQRAQALRSYREFLERELAGLSAYVEATETPPVRVPPGAAGATSREVDESTGR